MNQRIGIETPNGMVYLGGECELNILGNWEKRTIDGIVLGMGGVYLIRVQGGNHANPSNIRPIAPKVKVPMNCEDLQILQDSNPTLWFREKQDVKQYKISERCNDRVRFGDYWRKPEQLLYTLDYGKNWQKCEKEVEG